MKAVSIVKLLLAVATALATAVSPDVQAFWAAHSTAAELVTLGTTAIALFLPSPVAKAVAK